jgi:hypothetical protein
MLPFRRFEGIDGYVLRAEANQGLRPLQAKRAICKRIPSNCCGVDAVERSLWM